MFIGIAEKYYQRNGEVATDNAAVQQVNKESQTIFTLVFSNVLKWKQGFLYLFIYFYEKKCFISVLKFEEPY